MGKPIEVVIVPRGPSLVDRLGIGLITLMVVVGVLSMIFHSKSSGRPQAVVHVMATASTGPHSVALHWTVAPGPKTKSVSGFVVSVSLLANNSPTLWSATYPRGARNAVIRNLAPRTDYQVSVTAEGGSPGGADLNAITKTTSGKVPSESLVSVMHASQVTSTSVTLKWYVRGANTMRAQSFALDACRLVPHQREQCVSYDVSVPGNVFTYTFTGLTASSPYVFGMTTYGGTVPTSLSIKARTA